MRAAAVRRGLSAILLAAVLVVGFASTGSAQTGSSQRVFVIDVPGVSFEELLSVPEVLVLARAGGAALMRNQDPVRQGYPPYPELVPGNTRIAEWEMDPATMGGLDMVGATIRERVEGAGVAEVLVIVESRTGSLEMAEAKDELHPLVMAVGAPQELFGAVGEPAALTSDTTRRIGVVTDLDVYPTIGGFLGGEPAADWAGSLIRVVDTPAPFGLHERYLAQRRMYVPIGTGGALYLTVIGLLGVAFVAFPRLGWGVIRRTVGWGCLSVATLGTGMIAAGHLPDLTYATVVPFIAIVTVLGTMAFSPLERRSPVLVPVGIGAAVLAFFALEAVLGWDAVLTPFLGGSHLDGGRFYGLPNTAIGLLVGASLWIAQRLQTWIGVGLLVVVALVVGMPYLGSNLGGGVTLFASAGMWLAVRERERFGPWKGLAAVGVSVLLGAALLLLAHRLSPLPTHVTRFEEATAGLGDVWQTFVDRLGVGFDLIRRNPAALVPILVLPLALVATLRPPASIRTTFERWPAWRDAVLVTLLSGVVAYIVNDTGPAAAGQAVGLGLGGMLGVSLLAGPGKMGGS